MICSRSDMFMAYVNLEEARKLVSFCLKHRIFSHRSPPWRTAVYRQYVAKKLADFSGL